MRIHLAFDVGILDRKKLVDFGRAKRAPGEAPVDDADLVLDAIVDPAKPPLEFGCEIVDKSIEDITLKGGRIHLVVDVHDAEKLVAESRRAYAAAWQDEDWAPETLCEAAYETFVASNPNPSPIEIGFEIARSAYLDDAPAPSPTAPSI